jgi:predicted GNAT family acetyltransferase
MSDIVIADAPQESRFLASIDGQLAGYIDYSLAGKRTVFRHTEVLPAHEGEGVGAALARFALEDARDRGLQVVPICPFVAAWIMRHPDYADVVIESLRGQFENAGKESTDG